MRVALLGFGNVGRALCTMLLQKRAALRQLQSVEVRPTGPGVA